MNNATKRNLRNLYSHFILNAKVQESVARRSRSVESAVTVGYCYMQMLLLKLNCAKLAKYCSDQKNAKCTSFFYLLPNI